MKRIIFILTLILSVPFIVQADDNSVKNAGFVPSNIWYSKTPFFVDENIRVYTIIFNGSQYDLEGTVEFFDEADGLSKAIGKTDFSISGGGRVRDIWIDWKAIEGKHIIVARITKSNISLADGTKKTAEMENAQTGKSEVLTDLDTDGDKIGNTTDTDDDNDGVPDNDELKNGTNPLRSDSDGNGISDKKEIDDLAKKIAENKKDDFKKVEDFFKNVADIIPETVKDATIATAKTVDSFRSDFGNKMQSAKVKKLNEIKNLKKESASSPVSNNKQKKGQSKSDEMSGNLISASPKKPFAYAELAALSALHYFFDWKFIFYGVDFYILYKLIFMMARRIFHRR